MNIHLNTTPVCLAKSQALTLTNAKGALISCLRGGLWVTQDDDPRDIVLAPGESFTLDRNGPAIVWALAASSVEMVPARQSHRLGTSVRRWVEQAHAAMASLPGTRGDKATVDKIGREVGYRSYGFFTPAGCRPRPRMSPHQSGQTQ